MLMAATTFSALTLFGCDSGNSSSNNPVGETSSSEEQNMQNTTDTDIVTTTTAIEVETVTTAGTTTTIIETESNTADNELYLYQTKYGIPNSNDLHIKEGTDNEKE